ncbi:MAG: hypothetical protein JW854_13395 [Actinobacteria bacterium]|nr:hypothetical protein [Actinomycetota bacterium]
MKGRTMRIGVILVLIVLAAGLLTLASGCGDDENGTNGTTEPAMTGYSDDAVALSNASIKLWDDFSFWARETVIAAKLATPNLTAALERWNKVADDLGSVVGTYYGMDAGETATAAIAQLQEDAVALVTAALTGDAAGQGAANDALAADAEAIATFLDGANPEYWPYETVLQVLQNILEYTTEYAVAIIGEQWDAAVTAFDKARDEVLVLADTFSSGVIEQFPDEF